MTTLDVDAITNTSDETLTESNSISERIFAVAGNQLREELSTTVKGPYFCSKDLFWTYILFFI